MELKNWRMVNGLKTEILSFNCDESDLGCITLNSQQCCVKTVTKSLGLLIDNNLQYKEHTSKANSKARQSWAFIRSKCCNKWGLSIPTKLFLYTRRPRTSGIISDPNHLSNKIVLSPKIFTNTYRMELNLSQLNSVNVLLHIT